MEVISSWSWCVLLALDGDVVVIIYTQRMRCSEKRWMYYQSKLIGFWGIEPLDYGPQEGS